jgi:hypothetical protein
MPTRITFVTARGFDVEEDIEDVERRLSASYVCSRYTTCSGLTRTASIRPPRETSKRTRRPS